MSLLKGEARNIELQVTSDQAKDIIKPLFYLMTGKPDSIIKVFNREVIIKSDDIISLHKKITEKLSNYSVLGLTFSATFSFENNVTKEFGNFNEYINYDWEIDDITKSILIK